MSHITLMPAYGRDYKSKREIAADLLADRDFILCTGFGRDQLINWSQLLAAEFDHVREINVRYSKLRKVCVLPRDGRKLEAIAAPPKPKAEPAPLTENERHAYAWLIDQIMGSVHVATSDADVRKRIWRGKPGNALQRAKFCAFDQAWAEVYAIERHRKNQELYRAVMGGI